MEEKRERLPHWIDRPLTAEEVLEDDKLDRLPFARTVVDEVHRVSGANGFVVSIEGEWGSGKTTILHVVEKLLTVGPMAAHQSSSTSTRG